MTKPRIAISSCLLGENLRWDGGHRRADVLLEWFGDRVAWEPVCPEFEIGLGVPREAIERVELGGGIRLLGVDTRLDHTEVMRSHARKRIDELAATGICGFVLKSKSPSCGVDSTPIHGPDQGLLRRESGAFTEVLLAGGFSFPIAEDRALRHEDARLRFIAAALALAGSTNPGA